MILVDDLRVVLVHSSGYLLGLAYLVYIVYLTTFEEVRPLPPLVDTDFNYPGEVGDDIVFHENGKTYHGVVSTRDGELVLVVTPYLGSHVLAAVAIFVFSLILTPPY